MRRFRLATLVFLLPALAFLVATSGCGNKTAPTVKAGGPSPGGPGDSTTGGAKTAVEAKTWANLKGKVVFEGDPPKDDGSLKKRMEEHKDKDVCLAGDTAEFTWRVNSENKGVQNVVVFVEPIAGQFFKPNTPDEKTWKKDNVAVDQPHCAFEPHVLVAFPGYYDGKSMAKTDQKVEIDNSAKISHNTKYAGDTLKNQGGNETLSPGSKKAIDLKADPKTPITLNCDFHKWMKGYIWALDTPYYAVTDKDGNFEIKGVPAGAKVRLFTWHEQPGFFNKGEGKGEEITLKDGDNTMELKVKPK